MNTTSTSDSNAQSQAARMGMNNFDWSSFYINNSIYLFGFICAVLSHRNHIILACKIKVLDLYKRKNIILTGLKDYLEITTDLYIIFLRNSRLRLLFIKKYGMEAFNFLHVEVKFGLMSAINSIIIIFGGWFYVAFSGNNIEPTDFIFGTFNFANHRGLCITFATLCSINVYIFIYFVSQNVNQIYTQYFTHKTDFKSDIVIIPNAVYLSNISKRMKKGELENAITSVVGIPKDEFSLILYPKINQLTWKQTLIDETEEKIFKLNQIRTIENGKKIDEQIEQYKRFINSQKILYQEELTKKVEYTGRGVIFFYKVKYLQMFYQYSLRMKIKLQSKVERLDEMEYLNEKKLKKLQTEEITEDKSEPLLEKNETPQIKRIQKHFMFAYYDLIIPNIDISANLYIFVRFLLYGGIAFVILFLTTPMSMIQSLTHIMFQDSEDVANKKPVSLPNGVELMLRITYPFVIYATNLVLLKTVEEIGKMQRLSRFSQYHAYVLRLDFIVLLLNMFIIPAFSIGAAKSLFASFISNELDLSHLMMNLRIYESSNVLCLIIIQNIVTSYISSINNTSDLWGHSFSYPSQMRNMKANRTLHYRQKADDTFEFGYNYASDTTCLFISFTFGIYQPVLFLIMTTYYVIVCSGNIGCITGYFKKQFSSRCRLMDMVLNRAKWLCTVCFGILTLKLYVLADTMYYPFCFAVFFVSGCFNFWYKIKSFEMSEFFTARNYVRFGTKSY